MKKEFFADLLQVTKLMERDRWTLSDFFSQTDWYFAGSNLASISEGRDEDDTEMFEKVGKNLG